jgi:hypothetical protein
MEVVQEVAGVKDDGDGVVVEKSVVMDMNVDSPSNSYTDSEMTCGFWRSQEHQDDGQGGMSGSEDDCDMDKDKVNTGIWALWRGQEDKWHEDQADQEDMSGSQDNSVVGSDGGGVGNTLVAGFMASEKQENQTKYSCMHLISIHIVGNNGWEQKSIDFDGKTGAGNSEGFKRKRGSRSGSWLSGRRDWTCTDRSRWAGTQSND